MQLALRSRGLGSSATTSHLWFANEVADVLEIPEGVEQIALMQVAYYTGTTFKLADLLPVESMVHWERWTPELALQPPDAELAESRVKQAYEAMGKLLTPPES